MKYFHKKIKNFFIQFKFKIVQDFLKVLSGNMLAQGIGFLTVILLSRSLGSEKFGIYTSLIALFELLNQFSNFGLSTSYVKYGSIHKADLSSYQKVFSTSLISITVFSFIFSLIVYTSSSYISEYFFEGYDYNFLIKSFSFVLVINQAINLLTAHFQSVQNFKKYSYLLISGQAIKITFILYFLYFVKDLNPETFVYIYVFTNTLLVLVLLFVEKDFLLGKLSFSITILKEIYSLGFWVFLSSIAVILLLRLDILMLLKITSEAEVGIYSAALQLSRIFPLLTGVLTITLLPKIPELLEKYTNKEYIRKVLSYSKYIILLLFIIELFSPILIQVFFGEKYVKSTFVFQILLAGFFFGIIVNPIGIIFYHIEKASFLTVLNWAQLAVNYALNIFFIKFWGATGAATSTLLVKATSSIIIIISAYYFFNTSKINHEKIES